VKPGIKPLFSAQAIVARDGIGAELLRSFHSPVVREVVQLAIGFTPLPIIGGVD
jgi:hypothetical protein